VGRLEDLEGSVGYVEAVFDDLRDAVEVQAIPPVPAERDQDGEETY